MLGGIRFSTRTLQGIGAWTLFLAPLAFVAWVSATAPEIPHNDYWTCLPRFASELGLSSELARWTARLDNSFMTGAYVVYALNLAVTDGSNRGLTLVAWLAVVGILCVLGAWVRRSLGRSSPLGVWSTVLMSWLLCSPFLAMFWFMGFVFCKLAAAFFSALAIHFWVAYLGSRRPGLLFACLASVALAVSQFSSALVLFPLLGLAAAGEARRDGARMIAFLVPLAGVGLLWLAGYDTEFRSDWPVRAGTSSLVLFPFAFLGSPFTREIETGVAVGVFGVAACIALGVRWLRGTDRAWPGPETCWWLLVGFSLGNAVLTAVARSAFGLQGAFSSRYSTPVLFWISLAMLALMQARRPVQRALVFGAMCLGLLASQVNGWAYYQSLRYRASLEPAARVALQRGVIDAQAISGVIGPPRWFVPAIPILLANGWIPLEGGEAAAERVPLAVEVDAELPTATIRAFRPLPRAGRLDYRLAGWLPQSLAADVHLLMVDRRGIEIGRAALVPAPRRELEGRGSFWIGYLSASGVGDVYLTRSNGDALARLRCCDPARPLAKDFNPYASPHPLWYYAGRFRSTWLEQWVDKRPR
jgi:hypothetical protein